MTRLLLAALLALAAPNVLAQACTTSWTNAAGGAWTDGANWDNGAPTASSVACITLDGTYTVTVSGFTVDVLRLGGTSGTQTLVNGNTITVGNSIEIAANGVFEWTSGYMTSGSITNLGLIRLTGGSGARGLNGTSLRNEGVVEHADSGVFYVYNGGRLENAASWTNTGLGDYIGSTGPGTFVNEATGTFTIAGTGLVTVTGGGLVFDNAGVIDVQSGELRFDRPSTHTDATFTTAAGATLQFNTGGVTFIGTQSGAQAGALLLDDGVTAGAAAEWAFTGTGIEWTADYLEAGTLTNSGLIRLTGGSGSRGVRNPDVVLVNEGTVGHADSGVFYVYLDAVVRNVASWTNTGVGDYIGSTGPGTFVNEATGTFTIAGTGLVTVTGGGLVFDNAGVIDVQSGELRFDRPSTHTDATFTTAAGATLQFNTGGVTFIGTQSGAQAGALLLDDGVTAGAAAEWAFTGTGIEWTADYLEAGTLTNSGLIRLTGGSGSRGVRNPDVVLVNEGTVGHADSGVFYVYLDAVVRNVASWTNTGVGDYIGSTGPGTFVNEATGTFTIAGTGLVTVTGGGLVFDNAGVIDVQSGELRFDRPSTHTDATLTTAADAILRFNSGGPTFVGTTGGEQAGTLLLDDGVTAGAAAEWVFTGTGIEWTADYLEAGTLTNSGLIRLTGSTGSRGVRNASTVLVNEGTVEHADSGTFYVYLDAVVRNVAMWSALGSGDLLGSTGVGTFVNEVTGTFTKSGDGTVTRLAGGGIVFENAGSVRIEGGEFDIDRPFDHQPTGIIGGPGIFDILNAGTFTNDGRSFLQAGPGVLTWQGDWAPSAAAALGIEALGLGAGTDYDQLAVTGTARLGGRFLMRFLDGYTPEVGDTYTIITCGTACEGEFDELRLPDGVQGTITVEANEVVVTLTEVGILISRFQPVGPFVLAPEGGEFRIKTSTDNPTGETVVTQKWTTLTSPDGSTVQLNAPSPLTLEPRGTQRNGTLIILDAEAPAGFYTYRRYVGTQGVDTLAVGEYEFEKAALAARVNVPDTEHLAVEDETVIEIDDVGVTVDGMPTAEDDTPETAARPAETRLRAPFPNPAAGRATIAFDLADAEHVRVMVYDMTGRVVAVVADGLEVPGRHAMPLDTSRLATGVYVVRMTTGTTSTTQRLTVVR